jgi:hypothetical protein
MAKKRSAQLDAEIRDAIARIPRKPGLKTRADLDAEIDTILAQGLPAERYEIAKALGFQYPKRPQAKPKSLTSVNLFALTNMVIEHGPTFPARMYAVDRPHIKRAIDLGYAESVNGSIRLTEAGREVVADAIVHDIAREEQHPPRENTLARPELRAEILDRDRAVHQQKIDKLERALAKLRR